MFLSKIYFRQESQWKNVMLNVWLLKYYDNTLQEMHEKLGEFFFCPLDKKMISPHIEWYWKMSWFVHNFLQNIRMVPKIYALSSSYLDCLRYLRLFSICMPKLCSGGFK